MDYPQIDIIKNIRYHNERYVSSFVPMAQYLNQIIKNEPLMTDCLNFCKDIYANWNEKTDDGRYKRILTNALLKSFSENSSFEEIRNFFKNDELNYLEYLLSYCIGLLCVEWENDDKFFKFIYSFTLNNDWRGMLITYDPSEKFLNNIVNFEEFSQCNLLKSMERRRSLNEGFLEYYDTLSYEKRIEEIDSPYFEGEWFSVYERVNFIGSLLREKGSAIQFVNFLLSYSLPHIQYQILHSIHNPLLLLEYFNYLSKSDVDENRKLILQNVFLNFWYNNFISICKNYAIAPNSDNIELNAIWNDIVNALSIDKRKLIELALIDFNDTLGSERVSLWLFKKKQIFPHRPSIDTDIINDFLKNCQETYIYLFGSNIFNPTIPDLSYISAFFESCKETKIDSQTREKIYEATINALKVDKFYLTGDLDDNLFKKINPLANIIADHFSSTSIGQLSSLIDRFKVWFEGIKAYDLSSGYEEIAYESQFLMVCLYSSLYLENKEETHKMYKEITLHTLWQCKYSTARFFIDDYYQRILNLAELIAEQILPEVKDWFESEFVDVFFDPISGINTFVNSKQRICDKAYSWIHYVKENELEAIEKRYDNKNMNFYYRQLKQNIDLILSKSHNLI